MVLSPHLKLSRVDTIVALNEWIPQIVDAELLQTLQGTVVKVQVVGISAAHSNLVIQLKTYLQ